MDPSLSRDGEWVYQREQIRVGGWGRGHPDRRVYLLVPEVLRHGFPSRYPVNKCLQGGSDLQTSVTQLVFLLSRL